MEEKMNIVYCIKCKKLISRENAVNITHKYAEMFKIERPYCKKCSDIIGKKVIESWKFVTAGEMKSG